VGIQVTEMWTAGAVVIPDMFGVCGVDGGLVVLELVSVDGSAARDSRLAGFLVMGLWAARRISCRRVWIRVGLSVHSRFAIKFPLTVGSSCSVYRSFWISKIYQFLKAFTLLECKFCMCRGCSSDNNQMNMTCQVLGRE
jgi:hypothetical protein